MIDICTFIGILLLLISTGLIKSRNVQSEKNYLFAGRNCNTLELTSTLVMTELNTSTLISFTGLGFLVGKKALLLPFIFLIGLLFYALSVAKKWKELNGSSVVDLFKKRYGTRLSKVASLILILSMLGFTATYVKSLNLIFSPLLPNLNPFLLSSYFILITLLMTLRGGLFAIIKTDIISFFLFLAIIPIILFSAIQNHEPLQNHGELLPGKFILSLTILTMFTYILAPWYGQKIFSAKSKRVAFTSVILSAIFVFLIYGSLTLATIFLKNSNPNLTSHEQALPHLILHHLPIGIKGIALALLFAAAATTLAGVWSAMSSMLICDFMKQTEKSTFKRGFIITLIIATLSYILGNTLVDRIFDKLILANIPVAALSFALLAGFYWKKASPLGAYLSIITGLFWGIFCYFYFGEQGMYTWPWAVYGIPLIFASGITGSYITAYRTTTI